MDSANFQKDHVEVVGWACRLPGANSIDGLWSLLAEGRSAITQVPEDRFPKRIFGHPRFQEPGKSYTWAAGVIDDIWGFDPAVFGISPREAEQMDPQQRILLQLTWEALEDAGIPPSSIGGTNVGVFVGASLTEYSHLISIDPAIADSHFATGNALANLSNRISYIFDLHGPSMTIDTACSSSLVALHQAVEALRSGQIDTAIVGGINIIASPASFISFSQAAMLSPTGGSRAFSAKADGFVRAEGGVVLVLRNPTPNTKNYNQVHGLIVATDVNSDGRTNGISMPSVDAQKNLLDRIYGRAAIDLDQLAFIEAHGTGTPVGDPIEATAIGQSLGQRRVAPLPIGSAKTNVGHLEPASGLVGVLKALLALRHRTLPPSLNFDEPNPNLDFDALNLTVCCRPLRLPDSRMLYAGVNSFGFGGTNAHAIIARPIEAPRPPDIERARSKYLAISAATKPALAALAQTYAKKISNASDHEIHRIAAAAAHRRSHLANRLVIPLSRTEELKPALDAFAAGHEHSLLTTGTSLGRDLPVAFVYSGNGSQWAGMGIAEYEGNEDFRAHFDKVDAHFRQFADWSLTEALFDDKLHERIVMTSVAQPLIFAIQSASTAALTAQGIFPKAVVGHSVGEVAAAESAGILDLSTAVKVIYFRSLRQEQVADSGRMIAVRCSPDTAEEFCRAVPDLEMAAVNSPAAVTVAGPRKAIAEFRRLATSRGLAWIDLGLDYAFHTEQMSPIQSELLSDLKDISPKAAATPFISTVTGACIAGPELDAAYWWNNVRNRVQFSAAVKKAAELDVRCFIELGARSMLAKHIGDSLGSYAAVSAVIAAHERDSDTPDKFEKIAARALVAGAAANSAISYGSNPTGHVPLAPYPWQQQRFRIEPTDEAIGPTAAKKHALEGTRWRSDGLEWHNLIDTALYPELADHKLNGLAILPGTAFLEIAFAVARQWFQSDDVVVADMDILKPIELHHDKTCEIITRISPGSNTFEIRTRPRLSQVGWILNCRGKLHRGKGDAGKIRPLGSNAVKNIDSASLYRIADACGLNYGPAFRHVDRAALHRCGTICVDLVSTSKPSPYELDPVRMDACLHGTILLFPELNAEQRGIVYVPTRIDEMTVHRTGIPHRAVIEILNKTERSILANMEILDERGEKLITLRGARSQTIMVRRPVPLESVALIETFEPISGIGPRGIGVRPEDIIALAKHAAPDTGRVQRKTLLEALDDYAISAACHVVSRLAEGGRIAPHELIDGGRLPSSLHAWLTNLLWRLETQGVVLNERDAWFLVEEKLVPEPAALYRSIVREYPSHAAEMLLLGDITALLDNIGENESRPPEPGIAVRNFDDTITAAADEKCLALSSLLRETISSWPKKRAIRILQIGAGPLTAELRSLSQGAAHITIVEPSFHRLEVAQAQLPRDANLCFLETLPEDTQRIFDLIVAADGLGRLQLPDNLLVLRALLAEGGLLAAVECRASFFREFVYGLEASWYGDRTDDWLRPSRGVAWWQKNLNSAGFENAHAVPLGANSSLLLLVAEGAKPALAVERGFTETFIVAHESEREIADIVEILTRAGINALAAGVQISGRAIYFVPCPLSDHPAEALADICMDIKSWAESLKDEMAVWFVFRGAHCGSQAVINPLASGAWTFTRTLANEFGHLAVRRIDVTQGLSPHETAEAIQSLLLSQTAETEFCIDAAGTHVVRIQPITQTTGMQTDISEAACIDWRPWEAQRLGWRAMDRKAPKAREIEIEVAATGLNFRDVMSHLSLMPDEATEKGPTRATSGLECSGTVVRVGKAVKDFKPGDRVVAVAHSAFATHVTQPATTAIKIPGQMTHEAAATIPIAFITAFYSLVTLAKLRRGEWVLIHGGAGGVGLAAIQIAQARGAKVIATAGSPAKQRALQMLGVQHVFNSRNLDFVHEIRRLTGTGVDVVLNSLSGDAMARSMECLAPLGRFIELGKADFIANTHVGIRPLRDNASYYAVDLDQLMATGDPVCRSVLSQVMRMFDKGMLAPLPHSVFPAQSIAEAFRVMRQSWHFGKIVVTPPKPETVLRQPPAYKIDAEKTHLITGGLGGFGLEAARWLADRGVQNLILVGRHGAASDAAKMAIATLAARGVRVLADPCDVSDAAALGALLAKAAASMPPLGGVMHAAMVLDDGIIANLDKARLLRVLTPKIAGADNLDQLTRNLSLDYFVLFSSVTTMIGNPGQGNYVAANAYMEGLARKRRQEGLPALAVGWGPISDVGIVAQSEKLQAGLQRIVGARAMTARAGLDLMAELLQRSGQSPDLASVILAHYEGLNGGSRLAALRSPTYDFINLSAQDIAAISDRIDLQMLMEKEGVDACRQRVTDLIVSQVARVLHSRPEEVNLTQPLSESGLDSLMAVELALNIEATMGIPASLQGVSGPRTVTGIVNEIIVYLSKKSVMARPAVSLAEIEREDRSASVQPQIVNS